MSLDESISGERGCVVITPDNSSGVSEFSDSKTVEILQDQQQNKEVRSHKKKEVENMVQDVFDFTVDESDKNHITKFSLTGHEENSDALDNTARLYEDACNAEDKTIKANQAEIFMLVANSIAELSDSKIQTIIDYFSKNLNTELLDEQDDFIIDSEEEVSDDQTNASEVVSAEVNISTAPIPLTHISNSSNDSSEFGPVNSKYEVSEKKESLPEEEVSIPDNSLDFNLDSSDVDNVDNENFSDNERKDRYNFSGVFSDDDDEGYYYDLNTGETCTKSESRRLDRRSICAY
ncbi:4144_t:CDS:2 [Ambispora gerdemannii]|uniref:4144_t:CDS:1 n=1 Tax=Ambispora gerdemannii TaxID=144530 RepID=A0A9N9GDW1_9GLOM|nr:4144_t:CDS:2 [Ambispora gerdemannii]